MAKPQLLISAVIVLPHGELPLYGQHLGWAALWLPTWSITGSREREFKLTELYLSALPESNLSHHYFYFQIIAFVTAKAIHVTTYSLTEVPRAQNGSALPEAK